MLNAERIFFIRHALRAGSTIEEIFNLTKIDRWFLVQIKEIGAGGHRTKRTPTAQCLFVPIIRPG